ncbi:sulfite exporter TauE/SafE family protein [Sedimentitalea sp.]|uniref:sulfite exporter TauE/SafE family protein n=1 Tax=Sedimentitalea sp. TaxID=2048915 RepID=UPI0032984F0A
MDFLYSLMTPDLLLLACAALTAGTVRGFAGFGTALIYLPIAGIVLDPVAAVVTLATMDVLGPLPTLRRAAPDTHRGDLARLAVGTLLALPLGLAALFVLHPDIFRSTVSLVSLTMLCVLMFGWRYSGTLRPAAVFGTGAAAGFLGGIAGIPGPPVIFAYMASPHPARVIRANMTFYLCFYDGAILAMLLVAGRLAPEPFFTGLLLAIPNMIGNLLGAALFLPRYERVYRGVAYALIFGAALAGLPVWGTGH